MSHDGLNVARVDVYKSDGIAKRMGVNVFPSVAYLEEGKIVRTLTENITADTLQALL